MAVETSRAVRAAVTRAQLVTVGRRLFAERGYAGTATEEIVREAGVTRGALYHHFRDKRDLFRAVFSAIEEDVHEQVTAAAMAADDPWAGVHAGLSAFLDVSLDPAIQRIALLDAPSVLGWDEWREIGSRYRFGLVAVGLEWCMVGGQVELQPVAPLAHALLGALNEGALFIARADDRAAARDEMRAVIARLLDGLSPNRSQPS